MNADIDLWPRAPDIQCLCRFALLFICQIAGDIDIWTRDPDVVSLFAVDRLFFSCELPGDVTVS